MTRRIALIGNPNSGKTTMFNRLTGSSQRVGNWPGVTIERKEGKLKGEDATMIDLPGIYSMSPYSPEEAVSRDFLLEDPPDALINIVDASNIERNLYLTMQLLDLGIPTVIALNMMDVVRKEGTEIDHHRISESTGCRVVEVSALKGEGIEELIRAAMEASSSADRMRYSEPMESSISDISAILSGIVPSENLRWFSVKILEKDRKAMEAVFEGGMEDPIMSAVSSFETENDDDSECAVAGERYGVIERIVDASVKKKDRGNSASVSDRIDRVVTNKWLGLPIFAGVMFVVYYLSISTIGTWGTDWMNDVLFGGTILPGAKDWLASIDVDPIMIGLIVDGMLSGVGAVLGFLPQMIVLFMMLVILEECGYMARIAFVMDRVFRRFGLSGKSFIPMLIGTGCGVPGIMASRTIENDCDRKITVMTTTFMPCSAKLPIMALIAGAFFGGSALIALSSYFIGILCILMSGIMLKKWKSFAGVASPFIMELPAYHMPEVISVIKTSLGRAYSFVKKAGTFILLACALIWFLSTFDWWLGRADTINGSMLADIGNSISWIFIPLGWGEEWQFSVGTITGLIAKENVVGTFGVLFGFSEVAESGEEFWSTIATMLTPIAGFSFLVFNLICAPCFAAIGAMRRELGTWRQTGIAVLYQCSFAYAVSMIIYQFGSLLMYGTFGVGSIAAMISAAGLAYLLIVKDPFRTGRNSDGGTAC